MLSLALGEKCLRQAVIRHPSMNRTGMNIEQASQGYFLKKLSLLWGAGGCYESAAPVRDKRFVKSKRHNDSHFRFRFLISDPP